MSRKIVGLSLLVAIAAAVVAVMPAAGRSDGRQLSAAYCTNANAMPKPGACISLSFGDQTVQGYTDSPNRAISLRPGVYWLTVNDNSTAHNFALEDPSGADQTVTDITGTPGLVTVKVLLTPGSWVLYCAAADHRAMGMYVDLDVSGVGQAE